MKLSVDNTNGYIEIGDIFQYEDGDALQVIGINIKDGDVLLAGVEYSLSSDDFPSSLNRRSEKLIAIFRYGVGLNTTSNQWSTFDETLMNKWSIDEGWRLNEK